LKIVDEITESTFAPRWTQKTWLPLPDFSPYVRHLKQKLGRKQKCAALITHPGKELCCSDFGHVKSTILRMLF